jgi:sulfur carrier protein ThiS
LVITVHLHTTLQRRTPEGPQRRLEVTLRPGGRLADVLEQLGLSPDDESILLVVNARVAGPDQALVEGDEVHLIPALSGGAPGC